MNNKPIKKFNAGAVGVSVWENQQNINGSNVAVHSVKLEKRYKDKDGNWQSASSLSVNDIPKALVVLTEAYKFLVIKQQENDGIPQDA